MDITRREMMKGTAAAAAITVMPSLAVEQPAKSLRHGLSYPDVPCYPGPRIDTGAIPQERHMMVLSPILACIERLAKTSKILFEKEYDENAVYPAPEVPMFDPKTVKWITAGTDSKGLWLRFRPEYMQAPYDLGPLGRVDPHRQFELIVFNNWLFEYTNSLYPNRCDACGAFGPAAQLRSAHYSPGPSIVPGEYYGLLCQSCFSILDKTGKAGGFIDGWGWPSRCEAYADHGAWRAVCHDYWKCFSDEQVAMIRKLA